jgi:hypothetical protein
MRQKMEYAPLAFVVIFLLASCGVSQLTQVTGSVPPDIKIAIAPSGGDLAEGIGAELTRRGFKIVDIKQTAKLLLQMNAKESELSAPQNLQKLREQGIDAVLLVKAVLGDNFRPLSATVSLNGTQSWESIAGLSWKNGWAGMAGSVADQQMKKGILGAAREIADALLAQK